MNTGALSLIVANIRRQSTIARRPDGGIAGSTWVNKLVDQIDPNLPPGGNVDALQMRRGFFLCGVRMVDGDAGDSTTRCSYRYDLYNLRTDPDRTTKFNVDPVEMQGFGQRIVMAAMVDGEVGIAYRNREGSFNLIWVDESFEQSNCDEEAVSPGEGSVYASGTPYSLTATPALLDFGTTDPTITLPATGSFLLQGRVNLKYSGATFVANRTVTLKLRQTSGTPADITNTTTNLTTEIVTTLTGTFQTVLLPPVVHSGIVGDQISVYGSIDVVPSAGSLDVIEASLTSVLITS